MRWRWDQGRLTYFQYENILKIAQVLSSLDGCWLNTDEDLLRKPLEMGTGLPFAPSHYKVWRNYARVFSCAMLATQINNRLVVTGLCKELAKSPLTISSDQYLDFVFSRFTLPYAAFDDYNPNVLCIYPFIAIIKYVFVCSSKGKGVTLEDVFSYVIGNNCTGLEDIGFYAELKPTNRIPIGDEKRQVREMLVFMGQSSFLKWFDKQLFADTTDLNIVLKAIPPHVRNHRMKIPQDEFLAITSIGTQIEQKRLEINLPERGFFGMGYSEGKRVFGTHGKLERSPLVRKHYFQTHPNLICDACHLDVKQRYPWTDNILELHHVLPLSATINVNGTTTLLDDMVPLCPSCHKSIHAFYRIKLNEWGIEDFGSKKMAKDVYDLAKREIIIQ